MHLDMNNWEGRSQRQYCNGYGASFYAYPLREGNISSCLSCTSLLMEILTVML